ncbi:MAG: Alpha,alpha-trehalose-phosphate synthase (UDP-forming), partial [Myxococcaceae bacterium]|nr:Alpha,alpha-trehalose-phosphate synthase (UDP-forming) [Myxococcaceae bacterium]
MELVSRALKFVVVLVIGLGLLTLGASALLNNTTRNWFERDLDLRAKLAVSGARQALLMHWQVDGGRALEALLTELTRDERILSAAACDRDLRLLARTREFPDQFGCVKIGGSVRPATDAPPNAWVPWNTKAILPGGEVHVSATPLTDEGQVSGFVVLVHDMSFVARREAKTDEFLLLAFAILAVAASVITVIAARLSWRGWSNELRRLIKGGGPPSEFQPLLQDVRELVERIAAE